MQTDQASIDAARALDIITSIVDLAGITRPGSKVTSVDYYAYNITIDNLGAQPIRSLIQTQSDSDFVVCSMSGSTTEAAAPVSSDVPTKLLFQVTDKSDGKKFFNEPVWGGMFLGAAGFPYLLPCPKVWRPNTNIEVYVENTNPALFALLVNISFSGMRIYYA